MLCPSIIRSSFLVERPRKFPFSQYSPIRIQFQQFKLCNCYHKIKNSCSTIDLPAIKLIPIVEQAGTKRQRNEMQNLYPSIRFRAWKRGGYEESSSARECNFKPFINIEGRNVVRIVYSRRQGAKVIVLPVAQEDLSFGSEAEGIPLSMVAIPAKPHHLLSLGQSTQKPITGFPSVLPQHGKRISLARYSRLDVFKRFDVLTSFRTRRQRFSICRLIGGVREFMVDCWCRS